MKRLIFLLTALSVMSFTSGRAYGAVGDLININFDPWDESYDGSAYQDGDTPQTWNVVWEYDEELDLTYAVGSGVGTPHMTNDYNEVTDGNINGFAGGSEEDLMNGYFAGHVTSPIYAAHSTITNLESNSAYKMYIYTQNAHTLGNGQLLTVTVNGSLAATQTTPSDMSVGSYKLGQNVLITTVSTDASGTLDIVFGSDGTDLAIVNGMQIEAVPEPGSVVLLGVGGVFLLGLMRLKSKDSSTFNA